MPEARRIILASGGGGFAQIPNSINNLREKQLKIQYRCTGTRKFGLLENFKNFELNGKVENFELFGVLVLDFRLIPDSHVVLA